MNMDERLEALTHSLELLSLETEKHDKQIAQIAQLAPLGTLVAEIAEGTARLLRVAEMHEHRLDSHYDRLDKLE